MRSSRRRSMLVMSGAAALAALPRHAGAQAWPSRPIRLVEGYGGGGAPDIIARLDRPAAQRTPRHAVHSRQQAGRQRQDRHRAVAKATRRLHAAAGPHQQHNRCRDEDNLPSDFIRDIVPVAGIHQVPLVMEVHPSVPATTVPEFIALAKENPGKINLGSAGTEPYPYPRRAVPDNGWRLAVPCPLPRRAGVPGHDRRPGAGLFRPGGVLASPHQGRKAPGARGHLRNALARAAGFPTLGDTCPATSSAPGTGWAHPGARRPRPSTGSTARSTPRSTIRRSRRNSPTWAGPRCQGRRRSSAS